MLNSGNDSLVKKRQMRPGICTKIDNLKIAELLQSQRKRDKKGKDERESYIYSDEFSRKYDLPYNLHKQYIDHVWFDLEYYSLKNIEERRKIESDLYNRAHTLYDENVDSYVNYVHNLPENSLDFNNFFYDDNVFIDDSMDNSICNSVRTVLKREFYNDYFDPFDSDLE
jgi:hypothetical protein